MVHWPRPLAPPHPVLALAFPHRTVWRAHLQCTVGTQVPLSCTPHNMTKLLTVNPCDCLTEEGSPSDLGVHTQPAPRKAERDKEGMPLK